jgi:hypothetical protein
MCWFGCWMKIQGIAEIYFAIDTDTKVCVRPFHALSYIMTIELSENILQCAQKPRFRPWVGHSIIAGGPSLSGLVRGQLTSCQRMSV